jgi:ABC-type nitrate/sulfonate/bicarbonate transport system permease component
MRPLQRLSTMRFLAAVPPLIVVGIWYAVAELSTVPPFKLPSPVEVVQTGYRLLSDGTLMAGLIASLGRVMLAFAIGALLGYILGIAIGTNDVVASFAEPALTFFQAMSGVAWVPLAIVWFGFGSGPVLFVVANAVFFIVLWNTILGIRSIPPAMDDALFVMGATRLQVFKEVVFPGAMVGVLTGLRSGMAFGWRALIGVELIAATTGLGYLSLHASRNFRADVVVVVVIVIGVVWLGIDHIVHAIERRTVVRWGQLAAKR